MATWNLQQIQDQIAFEVDGNASISPSSADFGNRQGSINRALFDWANAYDWRVLKRVHNSLVSTSTNNASIAMPADFNRMDGYIEVSYSAGNGAKFPIVDPSQNTRFTDSDRYANLLGSPREGYVAYIHGVTLSSGSSVQFTYYSNPVSLVSAGSLTECPEPDYIAQRALYYIHKSNEDSRFPEAKVEADRILARMIENEGSLGVAYEDKQIGNWLDRKHGFRIGRD